jgi:hypothetical protein
VSKASPPLIAAAALAGTLLVGMGIAGIVLGSQSDPSTPAPPSAATGPVGLVPVDAPQAASPSCTTLLKGLPASLPNGKSPLARRPLANPAPAATAAWGGTDTTDPVTLRCGLERPSELTPTSELLSVDGVNWLQVTGDDAVSWYAVDRPVYVALTLPSGLNTGPLQEVSSVLSKLLPATPVQFPGN